MPGLVKFSIKGKKGSFAGVTPMLPLGATIIFDAPVASTGQCGVASFAGGACVAKKGGSLVVCK